MLRRVTGRFLLGLLVFVAACDRAEELPIDPVAAPDGVLDCQIEGVSIEMTRDIPGNAVGRPTPRLAVMSTASELLRPGDTFVEIDESTFSIVRAGKELVILHVNRAGGGGFVVPGTERCMDDPADVIIFP